MNPDTLNSNPFEPMDSNIHDTNTEENLID